MSLSIYKPHDGYWTRLLSGLGAGLLVLVGVAWLWNELSVLREHRIAIQTTVCTVILITSGLVIWYVLNKPRIADFMIATEAEMRKVNWPTRREIIGSTWIVICGTFLLALMLLVVQIIFLELFVLLRVLEGDSYLQRLFSGG